MSAAALASSFLAAAPPASAASVATWDKVAQCESTGNWSINTNNGYYGGLQISKSTWDAFGGRQYAAYPHQATKQQQILIAEKILAGQGAGAWSCSPGTGLATDHANPYPAPAPSTTNSATITAAATPDGNAHVNLVGSDGALYTTDANYAGTGWGGAWTKLDGSGLKALTSVTVNNVVHVFALGSTGKVFTKDADYTTGQWSTGWVEVPGGASGAQALTASVTGSTVHLQS
ncbi:transglycosylase family protein, partial [Kitasatospora purpeofusca]|uniref:transglycosylase family protein n=1 Tax=Kitasatospora purpeofusca TaxID=67352 RepID=UPI003F4D53EF